MERTFQESAWKTPIKSLTYYKIIKSQLDVKVRQFIEEELNIVLTKIKSSEDSWKTRKFDDIILRLCNAA